jgi:hypothetical protein
MVCATIKKKNNLDRMEQSSSGTVLPGIPFYPKSNRMYQVEQKVRVLSHCFPDGIYLVLIKDCAGKLSCCSGDVDAVLIVRFIRTNRLSAAGNCNLESGCCRKAREFELTEREQDEIYDDLDRGYENEQVKIVSIWRSAWIVLRQSWH